MGYVLQDTSHRPQSAHGLAVFDVLMKEFLVLVGLVFVLAAGTVTTMTVYAAVACHGC